MNLMPSDAPSSVTPLIRKQSSTTYGNTEEKYITYTQPILINIINNQITTQNKHHIYIFTFMTQTQTPSTLPVDLMPLYMARQTMTQAASRHPVMMGLNSPVSSMESVISRALRYQKYAVGELAAHSFTVSENKIMHLHVKSQISGFSSSYLISQVKTTPFIMHYRNS